MEEISVRELAERAILLAPDAEIVFRPTPDDEMSYGITMICRFNTYMLLVNCFYGGLPLALDVSEYDVSLRPVEEKLAEYLKDLDAPFTGYVYVGKV